jgi:hypothetical protein
MAMVTVAVSPWKYRDDGWSRPHPSPDDGRSTDADER